MSNVNVTNPMRLIVEPINRNDGDPKGPVQTFKKVGQAIQYFKQNREGGGICLLTEGPAKSGGVYRAFHRFGVRVRVEGAYGSRTIELKGFFARPSDHRKIYSKSNRPDGLYTLGRVMHRLRIGEPVYAEGNWNTIQRDLAKRFGWGGFSTRRAENGIGRMVTRLR